MRRPRPSVAPDIAELLTLVRQGRLFAVESWLREGRRVRDPANTHRQFSPLLAALKTGFHSLVELLLRPGGWSQEELDEAVGGAMSAARLDLVDLLLAQGAKVAGIDFADVCRTVDLAVMERYLRAGSIRPGTMRSPAPCTTSRPGPCWASTANSARSIPCSTPRLHWP